MTVNKGNVKMKTEVETITPARAAEMLQTSIGNRKLRPRHILRLSQSMKAGSWKLTGDPIRVDEQGALCDGHHRLTACVKSGVSITTAVVYDFPRELVSYLDDGLAARSGRDAINFSGDNKAHANERAATVQLLERIKRGRVSDGSSLLSNAELLEHLAATPARFDAMVIASIKGRNVLPSSYLAAVVIAGTEKPGFEGHAHDFLEGVATGAMLLPKSPIHALREWSFREKQAARRASRVERLNAIVHAWNAHATDKNVAVIRARVNPTRLVGSTSQTFKSWA